MSEDALNQFTTFAMVTEEADVETEASEVMDAETEVVEAETAKEIRV